MKATAVAPPPPVNPAAPVGPSSSLTGTRPDSSGARKSGAGFDGLLNGEIIRQEYDAPRRDTDPPRADVARGRSDSAPRRATGRPDFTPPSDRFANPANQTSQAGQSNQTSQSGQSGQVTAQPQSAEQPTPVAGDPAAALAAAGVVTVPTPVVTGQPVQLDPALVGALAEDTTPAPVAEGDVVPTTSALTPRTDTQVVEQGLPQTSAAAADQAELAAEVTTTMPTITVEAAPETGPVVDLQPTAIDAAELAATQGAGGSGDQQGHSATDSGAQDPKGSPVSQPVAATNATGGSAAGAAAASAQQVNLAAGAVSEAADSNAPAVAPTVEGGPVATAANAPLAATAKVSQPSGLHRADSVANQVATSLTDLAGRGIGTHRITLAVKPEALGEVQIVMTMRQGDVHVRLTGDVGAVDALRHGMAELHRVLEASGIKDAKVDVRDQGQSRGELTDDKAPGNRSDGSGRSPGESAAEWAARQVREAQRARTPGSEATDGQTDDVAGAAGSRSADSANLPGAPASVDLSI